MDRKLKFKWRDGSGRTGFTVIELMLAVAILGVIIYALFSVFNQTQRALRRSETNTDVAQKARAVAEMIVSELEQAQPTMSFHLVNDSSSSASVNGRRVVREVNMVGGIEQPPYVPKDFIMASSDPAILARTNFIHNIFFYNNIANYWLGIGYRVAHFSNGVGSLQRFSYTNHLGNRPISNEVSTIFLRDLEFAKSTNYHHIADGVVHLSFIPYDHNGRRLGWDTEDHRTDLYDTNHYYVTRLRYTGAIESDRSDITDTNYSTVLLQEGIPTTINPVRPNEPNVQYTSAFRFMSNSLPAYIELELGMLEPETLSQYYTMLDDQNPNAGRFLQRQISKVHLFRHRITIRTAAQ